MSKNRSQLKGRLDELPEIKTDHVGGEIFTTEAGIYEIAKIRYFNTAGGFSDVPECYVLGRGPDHEDVERVYYDWDGSIEPSAIARKKIHCLSFRRDKIVRYEVLVTSKTLDHFDGSTKFER
ncbi:MAG: hypothetical protein ABIH37_05485 [archaeon]